MAKSNVQVIRPGGTTFWKWLVQAWNSRFLALSIARRDLKVQFAQTLLGFTWVVVQPMAGLLVFTFFFGYLVKVNTGDVPYPLFAFSGMISWYYFTYLMTHGGNALVNNQDLIRKLAFPRIVLPLSRVITGMVEFGISLGILLAMMPFFGVFPTWRILLLPVFVGMNICAGLGVAIWLSALTIRFRDFHHIIPYLVNFGIWVTPVFYPTTLLPSHLGFLMYLNPMAGVIAGYRWSLLGGEAPGWSFFPVYLFLFLFLIIGLVIFRKQEKNAADWV